GRHGCLAQPAFRPGQSCRFDRRICERSAAARTKLIEGFAALDIQVRNGRVTGVNTSQGSLNADVVVVAAGLWSRALLRPIGIYLPQWHCEHFYIIAEVAPRLGQV